MRHPLSCARADTVLLLAFATSAIETFPKLDPPLPQDRSRLDVRGSVEQPFQERKHLNTEGQ